MRSTHHADRLLGRFLNDLLPELTRRAVAQRFVRMHAVVMLEPGVELGSTLAASGFGRPARIPG